MLINVLELIIESESSSQASNVKRIIKRSSSRGSKKKRFVESSSDNESINDQDEVTNNFCSKRIALMNQFLRN